MSDPKFDRGFGSPSDLVFQLSATDDRFPSSISTVGRHSASPLSASHASQFRISPSPLSAAGSVSEKQRSPYSSATSMDYPRPQHFDIYPTSHNTPRSAARENYSRRRSGVNDNDSFYDDRREKVLCDKDFLVLVVNEPASDDLLTSDANSNIEAAQICSPIATEKENFVVSAKPFAEEWPLEASTEDNFDYASAYYGRVASGDKIFDSGVDAESECDSTDGDNLRVEINTPSDREMVDISSAENNSPSWIPSECDNGLPGAVNDEKPVKSRPMALSVDVSARAADQSKPKSPILLSSSSSSEAVHTGVSVTSYASSKPKSYVDLLSAGKSMGCTCNLNESPSTASSGKSFPFSTFPQIIEAKCPVHLRMASMNSEKSASIAEASTPLISIQPASDIDSASQKSLPTPQSVVETHSAQTDDSIIDTSTIPEALPITASFLPACPQTFEVEEDRIDLGDITDQIDEMLFAEFDGQLELSSLEVRAPDPAHLSTKWKPTADPGPSSEPVSLRPRLHNPLRLLTEHKNSSQDSELSCENVPLWWRYLVYPIYVTFSSRSAYNTPARLWAIHKGVAVETQLTEETSPERQLEISLRRQKIMWNILGLVLTSVLLGGVIAGVVVYFYGAGGATGIGKYASLSAGAGASGAA
ncbi:uncharacterized protein V2V93DRAFT_370511 [Kockiozyma suomiensis]|uniref:uncharacterized protein n=1 Tax=Kockiozyma suomiensis TaxID=1337062 RepID=UPI003342EBB5